MTFEAPVPEPGTAAAAELMAKLLAAADRTEPRPLAELIERLRASGLLLEINEDAAARHIGRKVGELPIRGITFDSRHVPAGSLFVAVKGMHSDGHDFAAAAAELGAAAAIVERVVPGVALPQIVVDDARRSLAAAAAWWYDDPSRELGVIGITGTDGKTTASFLVTAVLEACGISTGLLSTAAAKIGAVRSANPEHVTTPDSPQLQRSLRAMVAAGNLAAVVETTSHGLALSRVAEIAYDVAVFTNLTHEHLELHGTFEAYRDTKLGLFRSLGGWGGAKRLARDWPRVGIVNADDAAAPLFIDAARQAGAAVLTYGESDVADVRAVAVHEGLDSIHFDVATPRWKAPLELPLAGRFNVYNALACVAVGEALGLEPDRIRNGLAHARGVPGRMEWVDCGQPFGVIVDYAHSPASLEMVLEALAPAAKARGGGLIAVFGSAGERDVKKRPMMGRIAGERCRIVVVTDEDPRGEPSEKILSDIAAGARGAGKRNGRDLLCVSDRRAAIETALERAQPGDVVLLAGKGHEQTIITSGGPIPWDEHAEAVRALGRLGYRAPAGAAL